MKLLTHESFGGREGRGWVGGEGWFDGMESAIRLTS